MSEPVQQPERQRPGHEERDVSVGKVALIGVGLMLLIVVGALLSYVTFRYFAGVTGAGAPAYPLLQSQQLPPEPRLQVVEAQDLLEKRVAEDTRLNSYGWVDRDNGIVHIPIRRAMDLIVEQARLSNETAARKK